VAINSDSGSFDREWVSQAEAARLRGVSRQAISRLIQRKRLRTRSIAGYVLVHRDDVLTFVPRPSGRPKKKSEHSE